MRINKTMIGAALAAAVMMAPGAASAGHDKGKDCFQAIADSIKMKMAHLDAKIDAMHAAKMSKHHAAAPAAAPKKAAPAKKVAAAKPMK